MLPTRRVAEFITTNSTSLFVHNLHARFAFHHDRLIHTFHHGPRFTPKRGAGLAAQYMAGLIFEGAVAARTALLRITVPLVA